MKHIIICLFVLVSSITWGAPADSTQIAIQSVANTTTYHSFYVDLFGQSLYPSLNYDYTRAGKRRIATGFNVGIVIPSPVLPRNYGVNAAWHWLFGKEARSFELGVGSAFIYSIEKEKTFHQVIYTGPFQSEYFVVKDRPRQSYLYGFMTAGLRFYVPDDKLLVRVYAMPFFGIRNQIYPIKGLPVQSNYVKYFSNAAMFEPALTIWGGFSIGYTLKPRKK